MKEIWIAIGYLITIGWRWNFNSDQIADIWT